VRRASGLYRVECGGGPLGKLSELPISCLDLAL
jgi:hypothetical protein